MSQAEMQAAKESILDYLRDEKREDPDYAEHDLEDIAETCSIPQEVAIYALQELIKEHKVWDQGGGLYEADNAMIAFEDEIEELRRDANRYEYIREVFAKMHSPKKDGQHGWRFHGGLHTTGNTFDEALDKLMAMQPLKYVAK